MGLEVGTRRMTFEELPNLVNAIPWGRAIPKDGTAVVHEIHQDCVLDLPESAVLLASSPKTRVEVWAYQHHVLCIQGKHSALHLPLVLGSVTYLIVSYCTIREGVLSCAMCLRTARGLHEAIYTTAGHPEFTKDFMDTLISWRAASAPEALPQDDANAALAQLSDQPVTAKDQAALQCLCRAFLKAKG